MRISEALPETFSEAIYLNNSNIMIEIMNSI